MRIKCWVYGHVSLFGAESVIAINNIYYVKLCYRCNLLYWDEIQQDD